MKVTINYLITLNQLRYGFHVKTPVTPKAVVSEVSLETQKIEKQRVRRQCKKEKEANRE